MKTVFVIRNTEGLFLGKQNQWLPRAEAQSVWRSPHHDVALNQLIEANSKDILQRLQILSCPLSERDLPLLDVCKEPTKMAPIQFDDAEAGATAEAAEDTADNETREIDLFDNEAAVAPDRDASDLAV